ncbi:MAG: DUF4845 domain-containing protein [Gammaproteobacteria bacterium]
MRKQQQGMTTLGLLCLLTVFGFIAFGVLQIIPVYLESMKVAQVLKQTKTELDGQNSTKTEIIRSLGKRVSVEDLYDIDYKTFFNVKRTGYGYEVSAVYSRKKSYVANLYLLAEFDHKVEITR